MDYIVEIVHKGLPFFILIIVLAIIAKGYLIARIKRFDIPETFFSFFKIYSTDQINMSSKRRRVLFMRFNNLINYFVYILIGFIAIVYFVTRNAH